MFGVSDMLGEVIEADEPTFLDAFGDFLEKHRLLFARNVRGRWRFHLDNIHEVSTLPEQQKLFLLNSDGTKGSWDSESKWRAREFAAAICTLWENQEAQWTQRDFTVRRLGWFGMGLFKEVMRSAPKDCRFVDAFEAGYLSFAANNPRRADQALRQALGSGGACAPFLPWTDPWLNAVMHTLTFSSGVAIYPHRYNAIRPVINKLYQVKLGELSLDSWKKSEGIKLIDTAELQMALEVLGYDIGPTGADGVLGKKTKQALLVFEKQRGLPLVDGLPDKHTVMALERELERHGREVLDAKT